MWHAHPSAPLLFELLRLDLLVACWSVGPPKRSLRKAAHAADKLRAAMLEVLSSSLCQRFIGVSSIADPLRQALLMLVKVCYCNLFSVAKRSKVATDLLLARGVIISITTRFYLHLHAALITSVLELVFRKGTVVSSCSRGRARLAAACRPSLVVGLIQHKWELVGLPST